MEIHDKFDLLEDYDSTIDTWKVREISSDKTEEVLNMASIICSA